MVAKTKKTNAKTTKGGIQKKSSVIMLRSAAKTAALLREEEKQREEEKHNTKRRETKLEQVRIFAPRRRYEREEEHFILRVRTLRCQLSKVCTRKQGPPYTAFRRYLIKTTSDGRWIYVRIGVSFTWFPSS